MTRRTYKQRIAWNAITVEVAYEPDWLGSAADAPEDAMAHLQVRSLDPDQAALPITETGYRSHFLPAAVVTEAGGPLAYVRTWLDQEAATPRWQASQQAARQYVLL